MWEGALLCARAVGEFGSVLESECEMRGGLSSSAVIILVPIRALNLVLTTVLLVLVLCLLGLIFLCLFFELCTPRSRLLFCILFESAGVPPRRLRRDASQKPVWSDGDRLGPQD